MLQLKVLSKDTVDSYNANTGNILQRKVNLSWREATSVPANNGGSGSAILYPSKDDEPQKFSNDQLVEGRPLLLFKNSWRSDT